MDRAGEILVLHVDDEPGLADMAGTFLEREDDRITVETATSPGTGLELLADHEIDCIVSDYDMPAQNGIEFLEAVRKQYSDLPFILYTGKGSEEIASDAISAGVTDYLQKESGTGQYAVLANRISNAVEQYRSRQAVHETEQKLSELAERTDDILFIFNGDWSELLFVNSAYEDIWGGSIEELEANPTVFLEHIHPEDREKARETFKRLLEGHASQAEYRVVHPDGQQRWVRGNTQPILDESGDPVRIVGQVRDVTDEKERELRLETVIDNLPGYVYRHENNPEYSLKFVKGDAESVTGYTATELEEDVVLAEEIIHPEDRKNLWTNHIEGLETAGRFDSTYRIITKGGDVRWIRDQGQLIEDPVTGDSLIDGFVTDVSDHIQRERELRSQQALISANLDALQDVYYALNEDGKLVRWNDRASEVSGYTDEEIEEIDVTEFFAEEHHDRIEGSFKETLETGASSVRADIVTADGERLPFEFRKSRLVGPNTGDAVAVGVGRDVSEQVRREQELARQNERLEQFASVVSHDLRSPLAVAEGRLELAREECDSEHLDSVGRSLDRMNALINDLLTLAHEGEEVGEFESVDLGEFVGKCWQNVNAPEATLVVEVEQTIRADSSRLQQLVENLMRNAIEHGGEAVTVTVSALDDGFAVEDDGVGISETDRDDVFETGYSTAGDGTGFGLSIVEEIADAHGWEVSVSDGTDGGARFEITGVEFVTE